MLNVMQEMAHIHTYTHTEFHHFRGHDINCRFILTSTITMSYQTLLPKLYVIICIRTHLSFPKRDTNPPQCDFVQKYRFPLYG